MPMPKGKKVEGGYCTLSDRDPMKFREIAKKMTLNGDRMNHATARGVLMKGMEKIAAELLTTIKGHARPADIRRLTANESFQAYVGDVLDEDAYSDEGAGSIF